MKHIFIINPAAGKRDRTEEYTEIIEKICSEKGLDYQIRVSEAPGDCTRIAREVADSGEEVRLYACGGDGTLNEVAAGAAGRDNVAVTVFAGGSGNDFIKVFSDPEAFSDLERLLDCQEATFDLIRCNDDYSVNICSVGLDARIGTSVARYKRLPLLNGFQAYVLSTIVNVLKCISEHYVVEVAGEVIDAKQTFVCVCNGRYYGGGFNPMPDADPGDGALDVLLVKKVNIFQVMSIIGKFKNGRYKELPHLMRHIRTNRVRIHCDKVTAVNLDGELRLSQDADIRLAEEKLRFFYPKALTWAAVEKELAGVR